MQLILAASGWEVLTAFGSNLDRDAALRGNAGTRRQWEGGPKRAKCRPWHGLGYANSVPPLQPVVDGFPCSAVTVKETPNASFYVHVSDTDEAYGYRMTEELVVYGERSTEGNHYDIHSGLSLMFRGEHAPTANNRKYPRWVTFLPLQLQNPTRNSPTPHPSTITTTTKTTVHLHRFNDLTRRPDHAFTRPPALSLTIAN
jgi:hypothetical protein